MFLKYMSRKRNCRIWLAQSFLLTHTKLAGVSEILRLVFPNTYNFGLFLQEKDQARRMCDFFAIQTNH